MNENVTKIDLSETPRASEVLKAFQAEKEAKLRDLEKKAEEYAAKLKKPETV